jgi:tRNA threonylcarbamoyladenosine biosynthesis protein TsaB
MKLIAIETSTEQMSVAIQNEASQWAFEGVGGASASATILSKIVALMEEASLCFEQLDAIVWGKGPGSFTGVRTACALAQGLAFAHDTPVLGIETLAACAEMAHLQHPEHKGQVVVALDARMGELYAATYEPMAWRRPERGLYELIKPDQLALTADALLCGNATTTYPLLGQGHLVYTCHPQATALLMLAPELIALGRATSAQWAQPLYIRDKVAQTTLEREKAKSIER